MNAAQCARYELSSIDAQFSGMTFDGKRAERYSGSETCNAVFEVCIAKGTIGYEITEDRSFEPFPLDNVSWNINGTIVSGTSINNGIWEAEAYVGFQGNVRIGYQGIRKYQNTGGSSEDVSTINDGYGFSGVCHPAYSEVTAQTNEEQLVVTWSGGVGTFSYNKFRSAKVEVSCRAYYKRTTTPLNITLPSEINITGPANKAVRTVIPIRITGESGATVMLTSTPVSGIVWLNTNNIPQDTLNSTVQLDGETATINPQVAIVGKAAGIYKISIPITAEYK